MTKFRIFVVLAAIAIGVFSYLTSSGTGASGGGGSSTSAPKDSY